MSKARLTPETTEGPYYKPDSPERTILFDVGVPGEKLLLTGYVFDINGKPITRAWLDFWQANGNGKYDNIGFTLRGHQYTDAEGKYKLETVVPGAYFGRTAHIHVKVKAAKMHSILTTQLFMPGLNSNQDDPIFNPDLVMDVSKEEGIMIASFNFVLGFS